MRGNLRPSPIPLAPLANDRRVTPPNGRPMTCRKSFPLRPSTDLYRQRPFVCRMRARRRGGGRPSEASRLSRFQRLRAHGSLGSMGGASGTVNCPAHSWPFVGLAYRGQGLNDIALQRSTVWKASGFRRFQCIVANGFPCSRSRAGHARQLPGAGAAPPRLGACITRARASVSPARR